MLGRAAKRGARRICALCLSALWLAVWPSGAAAQDGAAEDSELVTELMRCLGIEGETLRLQCYDSLVQPLAEARADLGLEAEQALHSFSGRDDHDTDTLTIERPWHLRWALDGSILTVELRTIDDGLANVVANQIGSGSGRSETLDPGTYRLAVRAIGDWQIVLEPD